ncbi:MAG TPA: Sec-independent protein translocase protein TatB [Acetobacteraceae bacterium]|nr:Sec-independent protein translocase protein TatB [Acetobacteraceae bacterium]
MFDFSWSEIMVIGVVALVLIGPKDLPVAVRAITRVLKKMRRMAAEFQTHVDDMMRDADLSEVHSTLKEIRGLNLKGAINRVVDADGSLASAFEDPFTTHRVPPVAQAGTMTRQPLGPPPSSPPPAFIPPSAFRAPPPAFVPPHAGDAAPQAEDL